MLSALSILLSTCSTSPTSVHACRLRILFFRIAVNMLHTSAWQVTLHLSNNSTMQVMPSFSWIIKFISKSKSLPTSFQTKDEKYIYQNTIPHLNILLLASCSYSICKEKTIKHAKKQNEINVNLSTSISRSNKGVSDYQTIAAKELMGSWRYGCLELPHTAVKWTDQWKVPRQVREQGQLRYLKWPGVAVKVYVLNTPQIRQF